jgi:hypothetical protein
MIYIDWDDDEFQKMHEFYEKNEPTVFFMTHYEIAQLKESPVAVPSKWKVYITDPRVSEYISQELKLLQQVEINKLLKGISSKANNVGTGQTLNALIKVAENTGVKEGPIFVYSYIPLSQEELNAPSVQILPDDPFRQA